MFGNQSRDYSGKFVGHCHCDACKRKYRTRYGKDLPKEPDEQYRQFMFDSSREVAAEIGKLIHSKRPKAGYFNYIQESTDGIMSESNTAASRPLPLWPYTSSDNVNRARNSQPSKMAVNLNMQFFDFPWRFATVAPSEITLRLWQNLSQGGALAFAVNGTFDHEDRQAIDAARPVFRFAAEHAKYYAGQQSAARVLLLGGSARTGRAYNQAGYRGVFRALTEEHIPFAVSDNMDWLGKREFDLVIATDWAPPELKQYRGRLLILSSVRPDIETPRVIETQHNLEAYIRVRNHSMFPSLSLMNLLMLGGDFTEVEGDGSKSLSFVPQSMYGPPEKIHVDMKDTTKPGIVTWDNGSIVWIPWDLPALYYKYSLPGHAGLLHDLLTTMLPSRQIKTDAHPLVEMSLMRQGSRTLLHLVNVSGHSDTAYFPPVPMKDIHVEVRGAYGSARLVRAGRDTAVASSNGYTKVVVPELRDYELIVLE